MAKNPDQDPISVSSVSEGFEPFAVADLWRQSETDILYIASDGVVLEQNADISAGGNFAFPGLGYGAV